MAVTDRYKVEMDTAQAQGALARLQQRVAGTNRIFGGMKTALAGIGFAAFGRAALTTADQIKHLSNSTGIAVARIAEFRTALALSGGRAEDSTNALVTFNRVIDEASQGALRAQNTFIELGVSMDDLRNLSPEALLEKTIDGLARLEDTTRRNVLGNRLFSESFKTVNAADLANQLRDATGSGERYAQGIERAVVLNDKLAKTQENLKLVFLETFSPAIDKINQMAEAVKGGDEATDRLITTVRLLGVTIGAIFGVSIGYALVRFVGMLGRGLTAAAAIGARLASVGGVTARLGGLAVVASKSGIFNAAGPHMRALRAIAVIITGIGAAVASSALLFDNFGDRVSNVVAWIIEELGLLAAATLNFPTDALASVLNLFGAGIKDPVGLGTPIEKLVEQARAARKEFEDAAKAKRDAAKVPPPAADANTGGAGGGADRDVFETERERALQRAKEMGDAFRNNNDAIRTQLSLETSLIGKSKEESEIIRAQAELTQRTKDAVEQLTNAKANLSLEEQKAPGVIAAYNSQIARVQLLAAAEKSRLDNLIKQQNAALNAEQRRLFGIQQELQANDRIQKLQDQMATATMPAIARMYKEIEIAARESAEAAIEAEESRRNAKLTDAEKREYIDAVNERVAAEKELAKANYENSRSFSTGWKQALNEYVENATNAADNARRLFETMSKGMEDSIVGFVKTGKFELNSLLQQIAEVFLRMQIQRATAAIVGGSTFAGFFANGGTIPAGQYGVVGERGPELVQGPASVTPLAKGELGGNTNVTYNINAVDAASFKQMIAKDPSFIHAVVMQGSKLTNTVKR